MENSEEEYTATSERHAQIVEEGERFFRRLAFIVIGFITIACGFLAFLFRRYL